MLNLRFRFLSQLLRNLIELAWVHGSVGCDNNNC